MLSGTSVLTAGEVSRMAVNLRFRNNEEDGFRPVLALSLPSVFSGVLVSNVRMNSCLGLSHIICLSSLDAQSNNSV